MDRYSKYLVMGERTLWRVAQRQRHPPQKRFSEGSNPSMSTLQAAMTVGRQAPVRNVGPKDQQGMTRPDMCSLVAYEKRHPREPTIGAGSRLENVWGVKALKSSNLLLSATERMINVDS